MRDEDKSKEQLLEELAALRQQVTSLAEEACQRKLVEEELRKSRAVLHAVIDSLPFNFFAIGTDGRYILQNAISKEQHGMSVLGKRPEDVCPSEHDLAVWLENNRRAFAGERVEGEVTLSLGGEQRSYYNIIVPVSDGKASYGILGVNIDITRRKQAEEALQKARDELEQKVKERTGELEEANERLQQEVEDRRWAEETIRQSNEQLQTIYEGMVEGLLITDIESKRLVRVNSSLCRMLGYSERELLGLSLKDIHPADEARTDLERFQAAAEGRSSIAEGRPVLRKDGSVFYADITGHRILYKGRPSLLALFRDITERRKARLALEREHRTLARMLQASDHERQLIAYDIHDGLAQELAGAIMHFQVYEQLRDSHPDEARKAYEGGVMLLRKGHLESRRLISGVRPPILDESGVVAAIAHFAHDPAFEHGPTVDFRSRVTFLRLAPVLENVIYRIVQEGLTNARNHSQSPRILVSLVQRGNRLRIVIRDWGVGFDPKDVQENRFGLEGIRERARLLGGRCRIRSAPGEGTAVIVEVPVVERETAV